MNTRSDATPFGSPLTQDKEYIMADATDDKFVTFLDSEGNEISNDPRWRAQKTLEQYGQPDQRDVTIEDLQRQLAELQAKGIAPKDDSDEELTDDDGHAVDENGNRTYADVEAKNLGSLLKERDIPLTKENGEKLKAAEARAALVADDAAKRDAE